MKTDRLQDALGMIRDDYVLDAHDERKVNSRAWRRWGTLAACLCLAAVCAFGVPRLLHRETAPALHPDGTPVVEPGADPVKPDPDPAGPGTNPDLPEPLYDWPVIYNQVTDDPAVAAYFSLAGRPMTEEERDAVIPEKLHVWLRLKSADPLFIGASDENGHIDGCGKLDCIELWFVEPNSGREILVGMWPADHLSWFSWASQYDPNDYEATHFAAGDVTLFQNGDAVWTYFTCGDVSYYVGAGAAAKDDFYGAVSAILDSDNNSPDLSILVPNP